MKHRINIVVVEPSIILRNGIIAVLQKAVNIKVDIAVISQINITEIKDLLYNLNPNIVIINPSCLSGISLLQLRGYVPQSGVIALQSSLLDPTIMKEYDGVISIYDDGDTILKCVNRIIDSPEDNDIRVELTIREKEIVACIAKGFSNKEIADTLNISTHTVVSHRRNITAKLDIYSASGLTIYAIVNKLVELDSIPTK